MKRVVAWVVFGLCVWGVFTAARAYKNPWAGLSSAVSVVPVPVVNMLPPAHSGCKDSKDCFHE
jgi:hypothetical protein